MAALLRLLIATAAWVQAENCGYRPVGAAAVQPPSYSYHSVAPPRPGHPLPSSTPCPDLRPRGLPSAAAALGIMGATALQSSPDPAAVSPSPGADQNSPAAVQPAAVAAEPETTQVRPRAAQGRGGGTVGPAVPQVTGRPIVGVLAGDPTVRSAPPSEERRRKAHARQERAAQDAGTAEKSFEPAEEPSASSALGDEAPTGGESLLAQVQEGISRAGGARAAAPVDAPGNQGGRTLSQPGASAVSAPAPVSARAQSGTARAEGVAAFADVAGGQGRETLPRPRAPAVYPQFFQVISPPRYAELKRGYADPALRRAAYQDVVLGPDQQFKWARSCGKISRECNPSAQGTSYKKGKFVSPEDLLTIWKNVQRYVASVKERRSGLLAAQMKLSRRILTGSAGNLMEASVFPAGYFDAASATGGPAAEQEAAWPTGPGDGKTAMGRPAEAGKGNEGRSWIARVRRLFHPRSGPRSVAARGPAPPAGSRPPWQDLFLLRGACLGILAWLWLRRERRGPAALANPIALALALALIGRPCRADDPQPAESKNSVLTDRAGDFVHLGSGPGQWDLNEEEKDRLKKDWDIGQDPVSKIGDAETKLTVGTMLDLLAAHTVNRVNEFMARDDVRKGPPYSPEVLAELVPLSRRLVPLLPTTNVKKGLDLAFPMTEKQPKAGYDTVLDILWSIAFPMQDLGEISAKKWPPEDSSTSNADANPSPPPPPESTPSSNTPAAPPDATTPGDNPPPPPAPPAPPPVPTPVPVAQEKPKESPAGASPAGGGGSSGGKSAWGCGGCARPAGAAGLDGGPPSGSGGSGIGALAVFLAPFLREAIRRRRRR